MGFVHVLSTFRQMSTFQMAQMAQMAYGILVFNSLLAFNFLVVMFGDLKYYIYFAPMFI